MIDFTKIQRFTVTPGKYGHYSIEVVEYNVADITREVSMRVCVCVDKESALAIRESLERAQARYLAERAAAGQGTPLLGVKG